MPYRLSGGLVHAFVMAGRRRLKTELPEVLNLSTRILVLREGRIVGQLARSEANQERVLRLMAAT